MNKKKYKQINPERDSKRAQQYDRFNQCYQMAYTNTHI